MTEKELDEFLREFFLRTIYLIEPVQDWWEVSPRFTQLVAERVNTVDTWWHDLSTADQYRWRSLVAASIQTFHDRSSSESIHGPADLNAGFEWDAIRSVLIFSNALTPREMNFGFPWDRVAYLIWQQIKPRILGRQS